MTGRRQIDRFVRGHLRDTLSVRVVGSFAVRRILRIRERFTTRRALSICGSQPILVTTIKPPSGWIGPFAAAPTHGATFDSSLMRVCVQCRTRNEIILYLKAVVSRGDVDTVISDLVDYAECSESADQVGPMHSVSNRGRRQSSVRAVCYRDRRDSKRIAPYSWQGAIGSIVHSSVRPRPGLRAKVLRLD